MTEQEITAIANEVLTPILGGSGYAGVEVRPGFDHEGDPSLFVRARFKLGSGVTCGKESNAAHAALRMTLLGKGDDRFPYLTIDHPDDEVLGDDDDDWRAGGDA